MARQVRDAKLETRASRGRLTYQRTPYRRAIEEGIHLTYRKVKLGSGTWGLRAWTGEKYREAVIGTADDHADADGTVVLSYSQAQAKAVEIWRSEQHRALTGVDLRCGPYTIADAMREYEAAFIAKGGKAVQSVRSITTGHIIPGLGEVECQKLTKLQVTAWFHSIALAGRLKRISNGNAKRLSDPPATQDAETVRRRRSTANRVLTVLKAALNHAHREGRITSDAAWRLVKPFRSVDGVRMHFLKPIEANRLLNTCEPEFRALVQGALLSGCRYGELCRLKAGDIDLRIGSVYVRETKSGKPRRVPLNDEGLELFGRQVEGKRAGDYVFNHGGRPWKASEQGRLMKAASERAGIDPAITFHGMRDTFASNLVMSGASIEVVAQLLGHADSRITAKHYAHLSPTYISEVLKATLPRFASIDADKIVNAAKIKPD